MSAASHKAMWMARNYPHIPFERHADDAICHCQSAKEARALWSALADRLAGCKLVLRPGKTIGRTPSGGCRQHVHPGDIVQGV
jgi:hypothetical protein